MSVVCTEIKSYLSVSSPTAGVSLLHNAPGAGGESQYDTCALLINRFYQLSDRNHWNQLLGTTTHLYLVCVCDDMLM